MPGISSAVVDASPSGASRELVTVEFGVPAYVGGSYADLVAEFVSWVPLPMDMHADGNFLITLRLEKGRCWRYRFLVDGDRWVNDIDADEYIRHADGGYMSMLRT